MSHLAMNMHKHTVRQLVRAVSRCWGRVPQGIGIDLGSHMIKTVALGADGSQFSLRDFSVQPVSEESWESHEAYIRLLETIQDNMPVPLNSVGMSLSGPAVYVKAFSVPPMKEDDLREHVALELDRYIAMDVQEVLWDVYCRTSPLIHPKDHQEHFLVVAKKEYVLRQINTFRECGINVPFVDVDVFALINMVTYNYGSTGSWVLVHLGPTGILMVLIFEGKPVVVQKESYRAGWFEDLLDQVFLSQIGTDSRKELGPSEVHLLEKFYQEVCDQINETLEGLSNISSTFEDGGILLSGGYAGAPDMAGKLAAALGMPVNIVNPFLKISVPPAIQDDPSFQRMIPMLGVAVGVALRGLETHD